MRHKMNKTSSFFAITVILCYSVKTTLEYESINAIGLEVFNDFVENILNHSIICWMREILLVFSLSA